MTTLDKFFYSETKEMIDKKRISAMQEKIAGIGLKDKHVKIFEDTYNCDSLNPYSHETMSLDFDEFKRGVLLNIAFRRASGWITLKFHRPGFSEEQAMLQEETFMSHMVHYVSTHNVIRFFPEGCTIEEASAFLQNIIKICFNL